MALPTYEELMLPLLRHIADGRQYSYADLVPLLQRDFQLVPLLQRDFQLDPHLQRDFQLDPLFQRDFRRNPPALPIAWRGVHQLRSLPGKERPS